MTDGPPDSRGARILEAVVIAVLTAAGTHLVEAWAERLKRRRKKRKPRRAPPPADDGEMCNALDAGAQQHIYPAGEGHDTDHDAKCWCKPDVYDNGVIVHRRQVS